MTKNIDKQKGFSLSQLKIELRNFNFDNQNL